MPIHFIKPEAKREWWKTFSHLAFFACEMQALNAPNAAAQLKSAAESLKDLKPEERAWVWLTITAQTALHGFAATLRPAHGLSAKELKTTIQTFAEEHLTRAAEHELTEACLWNPADQEVFADLVAALPTFIKRLTGEVCEASIPDFRKAAQAATDRVAQLDRDFYEPLEAVLTTVYSEGSRRERAWRMHLRWVRWLYEGKPIFSPDETETTPLKAVYQRLRCFWHEDVKDEEAEDKNAKKRIVHIGDLHEETAKWLNDPKGRPVRVITGGPGSGKSSFARAFALEAAEQSGYHIAFAELQHMTMGGGLEDRLEKYFSSLRSQQEGGGVRGLPEGPLALQEDTTEKVLLIFDGLDELTIDEDVGRELATQFIQQIDKFTDKYRSPVVKAIVLGRNIACQEGIAKSDLISIDMHHVAPLKPLDKPEELGLNDRERRKDPEIVDPGKLAGKDQRPIYYNRWAAVRDIEKPMPETVTSDDVQGLNAEPLLMHLLLLSEKPESEILDNPNHVYRDVFEKIHARNQKIKGRAKLAPDDFDLLMECVALASWRGAGRTASEADYEEVRSDHAMAREDAFAKMEGAKIGNVAVNFHARKGETGGEGFEFIHKSFSEYLIARALLRLGETICAQRKMGVLKEEDALLRWTRIVGQAELTWDILRFLRNEARIWEQPEKRGDQLSGLCALFSKAQEIGFPANSSHPGETFRTVETVQRCAETAMLAVINALGRCENAPALLPIIWPRLEADDSTPGQRSIAPRNLMHRLFWKDDPVAGAVIEKLSLTKTWLESTYLWKANLYGADLRGANLYGADLRGANLSEAVLSGAFLSGADLSEADLSGADLSEADLRGAFLSRVDLSETVLSGAVLSEADLSEAVLCGAFLGGANLSRADLSRADLSRADLSRADLSEAKCRGVS